MRIVITGGFRFPHGLAPAPRISAYAKGLIENGVDAEVICFKALERPGSGVLNTEARGIHDGVPFEYLSGTTIRPGSFWGRRWLEIRAIWVLWRLLTQRDLNRRPDAAIFFSNPNWFSLTLLLFKSAGVKCIQEVNEFPFVYVKKTLWQRFHLAFHMHVALKRYLTVLSQSLHFWKSITLRVFAEVRAFCGFRSWSTQSSSSLVNPQEPQGDSASSIRALWDTQVRFLH